MKRVGRRPPGLLAVLLAVAAFAIVAGAAYDRVGMAAKARQASEKSYAALSIMKDLAFQLRTAESGVRGYLLTGSEAYLEDFDRGHARIPLRVAELKRLFAGNTRQQERLDIALPVLESKLTALAAAVEDRRARRIDNRPASISGVGLERIKQVEAVLSVMYAEEQALLAEQQGASDTYQQQALLVLGLGALLFLTGLVGAIIMLARHRGRAMVYHEAFRRVSMKLQASLAASGQGIAIFSSDWRLTEKNDSIAHLLGLQPGSLHVGASFGTIAALAAERGLELAPTDGGHLSPNDPSFTQPWRSRRDDGWDLEFSRTLTDDQGFVLHVRDIRPRPAIPFRTTQAASADA